jgi:hypothetical protein
MPCCLAVQANVHGHENPKLNHILAYTYKLLKNRPFNNILFDLHVEYGLHCTHTDKRAFRCNV